MTSGLERLLSPSTIAVVGATESAGKPGRRVVENLRRSAAQLYAVHPTRTDVLGVPAYRSVRELPEPPDLVVIAVGAEAAVGAAADAAAIGVPYVVVLAGGFGEAGEAGRVLERRLADIASASGTRILGPNTLGFQMPASGVDTVFVEHAEEGFTPDGVVLISQSGSVGVEALAEAARFGLGLRCFVGLGNAVDLGTIEFIRHFGADASTSCICVYLEHLGEGRALLEAARAASGRCAVFFLKAGRTSAGAAAVASHTGRLAGTDRVVDGALIQHGVQRVADDEELMDAARAVTYAKPPRGNRVAMVTPAGGYGVMCADYLEGSVGGDVLRLATLNERTEHELRRVCLPFASVRNPVDLTAGADTATFARTVDVLLADPGVDILIILAFFAPAGIDADLVDRIGASVRASDTTALVFCRCGKRTDEYCRAFTAAGLAVYSSLVRTVRSARILVERTAIVERLEASREA